MDNRKERIFKEIRENRMKFRVDHFDIILQEYISRSRRGKLVLDPPYQRLFRWTEEDQSALIESILIGLPLPPIFVYQKENGEWEVIDGMQRTTTIINFMEGKLTLTGLKILRELNGLKNSDFEEMDLMIKIENFRIRIELVEETDDIFSQYQMFNRLNSNGEKLEDQERRNFIIYKKNAFFYEQLQALAKTNNFKEVLGWDDPTKEKNLNKQENVEFALKFFLGRYFSSPEVKIKEFDNLDTLLTTETINFLKQVSDENLIKEIEVFKNTFKILNLKLGNSTLEKDGKKINKISNRYTAIIGLSFLEDLEILTSVEITNLINLYYQNPEFIKLTKSSYSPTRRMYGINKLSKKFFIEER